MMPIMRRGLSPEGREIRDRHQGSLIADIFGLTLQTVRPQEKNYCQDPEIVDENVKRLSEIQARCRGSAGGGSRNVPLKATRENSASSSSSLQQDNWQPQSRASPVKNLYGNQFDRVSSAHSDYYSMVEEPAAYFSQREIQQEMLNRCGETLPSLKRYDQPDSVQHLTSESQSCQTDLLMSTFDSLSRPNSAVQTSARYRGQTGREGYQLPQMSPKIMARNGSANYGQQIDMTNVHSRGFSNQKMSNNLPTHNYGTYTAQRASRPLTKRTPNPQMTRNCDRKLVGRNALNPITGIDKKLPPSNTRNRNAVLPTPFLNKRAKQQAQVRTPGKSNVSHDFENISYSNQSNQFPTEKMYAGNYIVVNEQRNMGSLNRETSCPDFAIHRNGNGSPTRENINQEMTLRLLSESQDDGNINCEFNGEDLELYSSQNVNYEDDLLRSSTPFGKESSPLKSIQKKPVAQTDKQISNMKKAKSMNSVHKGQNPPATYQRGKMPKYLLARQELLRRQAAELSAVDPSCPAGHSCLPELERLNTLSLLKESEKNITKQLSALPIATDTLRIRRVRQELESKLDQIEKGLEIFSQPKVYVLNDD